MLLLVLGGLAGAYFTGLLDSEQEQTSDTAEGEEGPSVFYELPLLTANLNTTGGKARFIKLQVSLDSLLYQKDFT